MRPRPWIEQGTFRSSVSLPAELPCERCPALPFLLYAAGSFCPKQSTAGSVWCVATATNSQQLICRGFAHLFETMSPPAPVLRPRFAVWIVPRRGTPQDQIVRSPSGGSTHTSRRLYESLLAKRTVPDGKWCPGPNPATGKLRSEVYDSVKRQARRGHERISGGETSVGLL